jgi:hypothetical protein
MSQQAAAGGGAGQGGGRKPKFIPRGGGVESLSKAFRSSTSGIEKWTWWNANMSQQAAAGRGAGRGGGRKPKFIPPGGGVESLSKAFRSSTSGIKKWTFNTGKNSSSRCLARRWQTTSNAQAEQSSRAVEPSSQAEDSSRAIEPSSRTKQSSQAVGLGRNSRAVEPSSQAEQLSQAIEPSSRAEQSS